MPALDESQTVSGCAARRYKVMDSRVAGFTIVR